jgi:hypothetical protein
MAVKDQFSGLPIEDLICGPILAVAKGQAALCEVYLHYVFNLAWKEGKQDGEVNLLKFNLNRPVLDGNGGYKEEAITVNAPLLALVPVPAFTMDEATVQFTMEVKEQETAQSSKEETGKMDFGYSGWGAHVAISGSVTSKSSNTRQTDQSAKYDIYARAVQQPPAEGMSRLCQVFASVIEPISAGGGGK